MEQAPQPIELNGRQQALYKALSLKDDGAAGMYLGAIVVLGQAGNPDRLAQSALSLRELMNMIPSALDVPVKNEPPSLGVKVNELKDAWQRALRNTKRYDGEKWHGEMDQPVSRLLMKLGSFMQWLAEHQPLRREIIGQTLHGLDLSQSTLPSPLQDLNIDYWRRMYDFFNSVAHHNQITSRDEIIGWMEALEGFLTERLVPRTFDDFASIDEIIRKGEIDG